MQVALATLARLGLGAEPPGYINQHSLQLAYYP